MSNFRAKMQMVTLLKKYGMGNVAYEKLSLETEIFDDILTMVSLQKRGYNNTKLQESIKNKISRIEGDKDYAYKLLDKASNKYKGETR